MFSDMDRGELQVVPLLLPLIDAVSSIRIHMPKDLNRFENRKATHKILNEVLRRFNGADGLPLLDPIEDMKITDPAFIKTVRALEQAEDRLKKHPLFGTQNGANAANFELLKRRNLMDAEIQTLTDKIRDCSQDVVMRTTLKNMKRVLRRLGLASSGDVIELKGRVACEISTADELLCTELMFGGVLNELSPEQLVAVMSCLVSEEKSDTPVRLKEELGAPVRQLQEAARRIAEVMNDAKIPTDPEEYAGKFKPNMVEIVHAWCQGAKFHEVCKMTDLYEGTIIRCMRRLEELLRQFASASKSIGNNDLAAKFVAGISKLKRDIVFAASLYL